MTDKTVGQSEISLSVAMIVRDEGEHLPEALANFSLFADEICVVDTGSEDDTVAIAEGHGCRVGHFAWCDDFAAARNVSLGLCRSDWIFVLDADERVSGEDVSALRGLIAGDRETAYRFITRNYTNATNQNDFEPCAPNDVWASGFAGWFPSRKVRLFPNHVGGAFRGEVHELLHESLEEGGISIAVSDIPIHHYAETKSAVLVGRKKALYVRLGEEKIRQQPENADLHVELGNQYVEIGDYGRAAVAYGRAVELEPSHAPWLEHLGAALYLLGRREEAEQALGLAVQLDPLLAEAWRNLGAVAADRGAVEDAIVCVGKAVEINPNRAEYWGAYAVVLAHGGRFGEAIDAAEGALRLHPGSVESLEIYVGSAEKEGEGGRALGFLQGLVDSGLGTVEIEGALGRLSGAG